MSEIQTRYRRAERGVNSLEVGKRVDMGSTVRNLDLNQGGPQVGPLLGPSPVVGLVLESGMGELYRWPLRSSVMKVQDVHFGHITPKFAFCWGRIHITSGTSSTYSLCCHFLTVVEVCDG